MAKHQTPKPQLDPLTDPNYPPCDGRNLANVGKDPVYGGHQGTWGPAADGDAVALGNPGGNEETMYNNVLGNKAWAHANNPPWRKTGTATAPYWVRP